ncbi:DsbA family protein [Paenibacillus sp. NEAU-GSW1]|uniref:DsbA family protein n=1 Tax=Paenibacillus sp. NEAU-GSW1 TaxID=2682486 RepID=UPI0012E0D65C|nr:DsbA family protein [Paenibacillus sp. NEAU-GSW1]MUT67989.1 DsbA family protein [Paenibacillus sp. NEAU-GSW1]
MTAAKELIYAWDAYCGWCYGFSKTIRSLHENHPELPLTVLSGGLFIGDRSHSIGSFSHIPEANKRISQLTGVEFGSAYQELLSEGSFVMNSKSPAIGFNALRSLAPDRAIYLASAMQHAFYYEGMSLSDPGTYYKIALANNIDPNAVLKLLDDPASITAARADFVKVKHLGVNSYPTLLLRNGNELISLGGTMGIEELEERLSCTNLIQNIAGEHCSLDNKNGC